MNLEVEINQSIKPLSSSEKVNLLQFINNLQLEQHRRSQHFKLQAMSQIQQALRKGFAF